MQQTGLFPVHGGEKQFPQCSVLEARSAQVPLQQPGLMSRHGIVRQEPQWLKSELRSVQVPEQQASVAPHCRYRLVGSKERREPLGKLDTDGFVASAAMT